MKRSTFVATLCSLCLLVGSAVVFVGCDGPTEPEPVAEASPSPPAPSPSPSPSPVAIEYQRTSIEALLRGDPVFAWGTGQIPTLISHQICSQGEATVPCPVSCPRGDTQASAILWPDGPNLAENDPPLVGNTPPPFTRYVSEDEAKASGGKLSAGVYTWFFAGPALCFPQGDIFGSAIRARCTTPGDFDVTVTPPCGPQGRAIFRVIPGGGL